MIETEMNKPNALIIGSKGTIGNALVRQLSVNYELFTLSQDQIAYSELTLQQKKEELQQYGKFAVIICCIGVLHDEVVRPEKNLGSISEKKLEHYFYINTILPMLCMKVFLPLLDIHRRSCFACLSAMVGSTTDNQLGGWYGYRSSKAALNSLIKTTSIEMARKNKNATVIAIHPGTTVSSLSQPFSKNIKRDKYYTPDQTAERILHVIANSDSSLTGAFLNWNGDVIPY